MQWDWTLHLHAQLGHECHCDFYCNAELRRRLAAPASPNAPPIWAQARGSSQIEREAALASRLFPIAQGSHRNEVFPFGFTSHPRPGKSIGVHNSGINEEMLVPWKDRANFAFPIIPGGDQARPHYLCPGPHRARRHQHGVYPTPLYLHCGTGGVTAAGTVNHRSRGFRSGLP